MTKKTLSLMIEDAIASHSQEMAGRLNLSAIGNDIHTANSYFRNLLIQAPIKTIDERGCLLDDVTDEVWIEYFRDHVAPTLVRFNLI